MWLPTKNDQAGTPCLQAGNCKQDRFNIQEYFALLLPFLHKGHENSKQPTKKMASSITCSEDPVDSPKETVCDSPQP